MAADISKTEAAQCIQGMYSISIASPNRTGPGKHGLQETCTEPIRVLIKDEMSIIYKGKAQVSVDCHGNLALNCTRNNLKIKVCRIIHL